MTNNDSCSCGCLAPHQIAVRDLADGSAVSVWSDGEITLGRTKLGATLAGLGRPRSRYTRNLRRRAIMLMVDDFGLFDLSEVSAIVRTAERSFSGGEWSSVCAQRTWVIRKAGAVA